MFKTVRKQNVQNKISVQTSTPTTHIHTQMHINLDSLIEGATLYFAKMLPFMLSNLLEKVMGGWQIGANKHSYCRVYTQTLSVSTMNTGWRCK